MHEWLLKVIYIISRLVLDSITACLTSANNTFSTLRCIRLVVSTKNRETLLVTTQNRYVINPLHK